MNAARTGRSAIALAPSEAAGTIASRKGRPSVTPTPRRNVRRGKEILLMTTGPLLSGASDTGARRASLCGSDLVRFLLLLTVSHLKRHARHNPHYERRETKIVIPGPAHDGANDGHVLLGQPTAER